MTTSKPFKPLSLGEVWQTNINLPDDFKVSLNRDVATMTSTITAQIEQRAAQKLAEDTIDRLASFLGMSGPTLVDFLRFLSTDPEIRDRFTAYRTAQRLSGERVW